MGYIRGYKNDGGGVKPHYLTFYSTFGGLNSSFGAKNKFELELGEDDTEIYFNRPDGGYELVLQKNTETGEWYNPNNVAQGTEEEQNNGDGQLLHPDDYDEFVTDIYLCDDVYRSDNTPTHGTASIALPMAQDVLELKDYDILLCGDGCDPAAVVSRASQGYAPAYRVVSDGEIDGNFKMLKFKMEIPEGMLEDIKAQGVYDQIIEELGGQYYYLLVLDEKHYAYIHLERTEGVEKIEDEAELADGIVKNAKINFEPKNEKLDLTIERVIRLAENKGEELTWSDFEMYNGRDIGSGLYIMNYEIDETFDLMVGGVPDSEPMYIRLVTKADRDNYIDIRTEDVEKFVSENREAASSTEVPGSYYSEVKEISALPSAEENAIITGHTVGYTSRFYVFEPGLKCYRYDHGTEKYYEFILTLPSEYTDAEIISISSGGGSGEAEIITKASDENGATIYLGCVFFITVDNPLYEAPLGVMEYTEQELIDSGVIKEKESSIDWQDIDGEWYYGFKDANGYQFYRLVFDMETATMNFDYGYYESEYVNRYTGTFTIDSVSQEITAVLHDDSIVHTDPDILMKFRLATAKNGNIIWKVLSCDVEKYTHLIGTDIEFAKNMPSLIELSAVADGEFKIYTIPQDGDNFLVLKIPETWYHDGEHFVEEYNGAPAYPTVKRVAYRKISQMLQEFTNELRSTEPGYTQYDMDRPINGKTDAGHTYVGYFGDGEQIKGLPHRRYLFYISMEAGSYILEIWQYPEADGDDFADKILAPIVKSFVVDNKGTQNQNDTSPVFDDALISVQSAGIFVKPYENFVWAQSWSEDGWLSADGMRVSYKFSDVDNDIPSITYSDNFAIHYGDGVEFLSLMVYDSAFERVPNTDNIDALNELAEGTYYLVITVKKQGDYIESDDKYEYTGYECVYKITIANNV